MYQNQYRKPSKGVVLKKKNKLKSVQSTISENVSNLITVPVKAAKRSANPRESTSKQFNI